MGRFKRTFFLSLLGALVVAGTFYVTLFDITRAQNNRPEHQKKPPKQKPALAPPRVTIPDDAKTLLLVRTALLTLNDGLRSGNFTVLRDSSAPAFRDANSAAKLGRIFASLQAQGIDLSAVAVIVPKYSGKPVIDKQQLLHIKGHFPGKPVQINFALIFQAVSGRWRLFSLSVNPVNVSQRTN